MFHVRRAAAGRRYARDAASFSSPLIIIQGINQRLTRDTEGSLAAVVTGGFQPLRHLATASLTMVSLPVTPGPPFPAISGWRYNYHFLVALLTTPSMGPEAPCLAGNPGWQC